MHQSTICYYLSLFVVVLSILGGQGKKESFDEEWKLTEHLNLWYHPIDLCLIADKRNVSVDIITKDCEERVSKAYPQSKLPPERCRVGNTWPSRSKYCDSSDIPFAERRHFQTSLNGHDAPNDDVLKQFFVQLTKKNGVLLLIGDSVMQQFFNAIACELVREKVWNNYDTFQNTDETQYVSLKELSLFPNEHGNNADLSQKSAIKFLPIYHFVDGRHDRRPQAAFNSLKSTLQDLLQSHKTLYLFMNMGLHYIDNPAPGFSKRDYAAQMEKLFLYLDEVSRNHSKTHEIQMIWRETSAQHFMTLNGYWPGIKYIRGMTLKCSPLRDTSAASDWRNRIVEDIIARNHLKSIKVMPFYNVTIPLWSQHPNGKLKDCTHFCWTPMLYQSSFHYLKNLITSFS